MRAWERGNTHCVRVGSLHGRCYFVLEIFEIFEIFELFLVFGSAFASGT